MTTLETFLDAVAFSTWKTGANMLSHKADYFRSQFEHGVNIDWAQNGNRYRDTLSSDLNESVELTKDHNERVAYALKVLGEQYSISSIPGNPIMITVHAMTAEEVAEILRHKVPTSAFAVSKAQFGTQVSGPRFSAKHLFAQGNRLKLSDAEIFTCIKEQYARPQ